MKILLLQEFLTFLESAPEEIKTCLLMNFWVFIFFIIIFYTLKFFSKILEIIFNGHFNNFYLAMVNVTRNVGKVLVGTLDGALDNLKLPEPYPRLERFFAIYSMLNMYVASVIFAIIFVVVFMIMIPPESPSVLKQAGAILFAIFLLYFVAFNFIQAERERIKLFRSDKN